MADFDIFANQLLEEAKRFLEKASQASDVTAQAANLHAALMLSFCALEAHINLIGEEFSIRTDLSAHEKGLLLERDVRLEDGEFKVQKTLKMVRLEDRIEFLHAKLSGKPVDKSAAWWGHLISAVQLRNELTHAKAIPSVTETAVRSAIQAILSALDTLVKAIYKKKLPAAQMGLNSVMTF
ncbi:MAG TPA: hypothetical protein VN943_11905 [Candidatus Acidoferrum sp.]|nr:hypothetical protein [Candidatus Acidoferrum sp.]